ncbi:hypothetical protein PM082_009847 [Marasmius tenuissimus]|nr:hypothetical protein PM082_009847 [Marasmius tenuissimus]
MVAELSSEDDYEDDEGEGENDAPLGQDDNDFIDDSLQHENHPLPHLLPLKEQSPGFWRPSLPNPQVPNGSLENADPLEREAEGDAHDQVARILQRTDPQLLSIGNACVSIPPSPHKNYSHFSRPTHVLTEPSISYTFSTTSRPAVPSNTGFSPDPSSSIPAKRTLAEVSASSAPFGTFFVKKSRSSARKEKPKPRRELAPGEWVEVRAGQYKGNVGMLWRPDVTETGTYGYFLLLVPRLAYPKPPEPADPDAKAPNPNDPVLTTLPQESPPPRLFSPEDFDGGVECESDATFRFRKQTFSHGLVIKFLRDTSVTPTRVVPSHLGELFLRSKHPFLASFPLPLPEYFVFRIGDKVLPSGESRAGVIEEIGDELCVVTFKESNSEKQNYPLASVEKIVVPGDTVEVLAGEHLGKEGFVSERHGSVLCVLARDDRHAKTNFFVNVNSVKVGPLSFDLHEDMPWRNLEVSIIHGRYRDMRAVVKSARLTPLRDRLKLLVFITELACLWEVELDAVIEAVTKKSLPDYQPLKPSQKARFGVDKLMARMRTGRVPWGIVRDVDRSPQGVSGSGLLVSVELQVISPNMSHRVEKIDYAHVREVDSRLELAKCMPLTQAQVFYKPWLGTKKGEPKMLCYSVQVSENPYASSSSTPAGGTPIHISEYENLDWDDVANPWNPHSLSPAVWSSPDFIVRSSPASPIADQVLSHPKPVALSPRPSRPPPPPLPLHWILHPRLLGISIRVAITSGKWKRKTAFVTPTSSERGPYIAFHLKYEKHVINSQWIRKHTERPKPNSEQALMIVTGGDEQHIGKFVRRIFYFYNQSRTDEARWFIVGVIDRTGRHDNLMKEILELPPTSLDVVEESKEDREAGNTLFENLRYAAKVGKPEVRQPGEGDLGDLYKACASSMVF